MYSGSSSSSSRSSSSSSSSETQAQSESEEAEAEEPPTKVITLTPIVQPLPPHALSELQTCLNVLLSKAELGVTAIDEAALTGSSSPSSHSSSSLVQVDLAGAKEEMRAYLLNTAQLPLPPPPAAPALDLALPPSSRSSLPLPPSLAPSPVPGFSGLSGYGTFDALGKTPASALPQSCLDWDEQDQDQLQYEHEHEHQGQGQGQGEAGGGKAGTWGDCAVSAIGSIAAVAGLSWLGQHSASSSSSSPAPHHSSSSSKPPSHSLYTINSLSEGEGEGEGESNDSDGREPTFFEGCGGPCLVDTEEQEEEQQQQQQEQQQQEREREYRDPPSSPASCCSEDSTSDSQETTPSQRYVYQKEYGRYHGAFASPTLPRGPYLP